MRQSLELLGSTCSNTHGPTVHVQRRLKIHHTNFMQWTSKEQSKEAWKWRYCFKYKRKVMGIVSFISSSTVHMTSFFPRLPKCWLATKKCCSDLLWAAFLSDFYLVSVLQAVWSLTTWKNPLLTLWPVTSQRSPHSSSSSWSTSRCPWAPLLSCVLTWELTW